MKIKENIKFLTNISPKIFFRKYFIVKNVIKFCSHRRNAKTRSRSRLFGVRYYQPWQ